MKSFQTLSMAAALALPQGRTEEERLVADMIVLSCQHGRYGDRRVAALLRDAGWQVNDQRPSRQICRPGSGRTRVAA